MTILIVINDAPYGSEKAYNALRLATQLSKSDATVHIRLFLMADAVTCALPKQQTPNGYYNIERMIKLAVQQGTDVRLCGSCVEARGLSTLGLVEGAKLSTMAELSQWVIESDKILTF